MVTIVLSLLFLSYMDIHLKLLLCSQRLISYIPQKNPHCLKYCHILVVPYRVCCFALRSCRSRRLVLVGYTQQYLTNSDLSTHSLAYGYLGSVLCRVTGSGHAGPNWVSSVASTEIRIFEKSLDPILQCQVYHSILYRQKARHNVSHY